MTPRQLETMKARADRLVNAALRISEGDCISAITLLTRRCRPSRPHLMARTILVAAGVIAAIRKQEEKNRPRAEA